MLLYVVYDREIADNILSSTVAIWFVLSFRKFLTRCFLKHFSKTMKDKLCLCFFVIIIASFPSAVCGSYCQQG